MSYTITNLIPYSRLLRLRALARGERWPLPRNTYRFMKFYPDGRAVLRDNPDPTLPFLTSAEMAIENERRRNSATL